MSIGLSAAEIADMGETAESIFNDTAQIYRSTKTSNGQGGHTSTPASVGSAFPCLLAPLKRQADDEEAGERNIKHHRRVLTYPSDITVLITDEIEVQGSRWSVVELMEPRSINIVNRAELVRTA